MAFKRLTPALLLAALAGLLSGAETQVTVTGRLLDVNGHTEFPKGLMGLHADAKLPPERRDDWGVESFRQVHFVPGADSIAWDKNGLKPPFKDMPMVIDCQGDHFYPAVPGARHSNATPYGAFNYGLRDIVELTYRCPDKAAARTAHGSLTPGWGGGGDEFLFKLLKEFRGRLVHTACDDPDLWPIAVLNGDRLVVVAFNDHADDRPIRLAIDAPAGTTFGPGRKVWVTPREEKGPLQFHEEAVPASGTRFQGDVTIAQKTGVKLVFPLRGTPSAKTRWLRTQFFAKGILQKVEKDRPVNPRPPPARHRPRLRNHR